MVVLIMLIFSSIGGFGLHFCYLKGSTLDKTNIVYLYINNV